MRSIIASAVRNRDWYALRFSLSSREACNERAVEAETWLRIRPAATLAMSRIVSPTQSANTTKVASKPNSQSVSRQQTAASNLTRRKLKASASSARDKARRSKPEFMLPRIPYVLVSLQEIFAFKTICYKNNTGTGRSQQSGTARDNLGTNRAH